MDSSRPARLLGMCDRSGGCWGGQLARGADFLPRFHSQPPLKSKSWNNGSGPVRFPAFPKNPSVPIADSHPERSTASNLIKMADVGQWQQSLLGGSPPPDFSSSIVCGTETPPEGPPPPRGHYPAPVRDNRAGPVLISHVGASSLLAGGAF